MGCITYLHDCNLALSALKTCLSPGEAALQDGGRLEVGEGPSCPGREGQCLPLVGPRYQPCSRPQFYRRLKHSRVVFLPVSGKGLLTVPWPQTSARIPAIRVSKGETQPLPHFPQTSQSPPSPLVPKHFLLSLVDVAASVRGVALNHTVSSNVANAPSPTPSRLPLPHSYGWAGDCPPV